MSKRSGGFHLNLKGIMAPKHFVPSTGEPLLLYPLTTDADWELRKRLRQIGADDHHAFGLALVTALVRRAGAVSSDPLPNLNSAGHVSKLSLQSFSAGDWEALAAQVLAIPGFAKSYLAQHPEVQKNEGEGLMAFLHRVVRLYSEAQTAKEEADLLALQKELGGVFGFGTALKEETDKLIESTIGGHSSAARKLEESFLGAHRPVPRYDQNSILNMAMYIPLADYNPPKNPLVDIGKDIRKMVETQQQTVVLLGGLRELTKSTASSTKAFGIASILVMAVVGSFPLVLSYCSSAVLYGTPPPSVLEGDLIAPAVQPGREFQEPVLSPTGSSPSSGTKPAEPLHSEQAASFITGESTIPAGAVEQLKPLKATGVEVDVKPEAGNGGVDSEGAR